MAVFTTFSEEALSRYLIMFNRGALADWSAIEGGIENSNYLITLDDAGRSSDYVLTIIEGMSFSDVPFFNKLLQRLHHHGLPVPAPQATLDGMTSTSFCGKPAVLFQRLPGEHLVRAEEDHCHALGRFMAESHQVLASMDDRRANPYPHTWMSEALTQTQDRLTGDDIDLLRELVGLYASLESRTLPEGLIHGDLFLDNALFDGDRLTGVIDFYHACHDYLIQDLAIAVNDWCLTDDGQPDPALEAAMINGYESFRELTADEKAVFRDVRRISTARFALTRLLSGDPPLKDPAKMISLARALA